jgi:hypothetical protein
MCQPNQTGSPLRSRKGYTYRVGLNQKGHKHLQKKKLKNKINGTKVGQSKFEEMMTDTLDSNSAAGLESQQVQ